MQPLYNDEYGVLRLMSTLPSDQQTQPQYGSEGFLEQTSWLTRLKKWLIEDECTPS